MRLLAVLLLCVLGLSQSTSPASLASSDLPHDAYIWQRVWKPVVLAAAAHSADIVRTWRVLAAEADRSGRWISVEVPWAALAATGRPVIAVIRIDGRIDETRMPALLERAQATVGKVAGAIALAGVEIDYDCPTSKLPAYATFLAELRPRLPAALRLSITALPTWMTSVELARLANQADELVLQVHAVDDPRRGLFEPARAEAWVRAFGSRVHRPFRVALPAYDVRVSWSADGRLAGVEGEMPLLLGTATDSATLAAPPEAVLRFLHAIERDVPDRLAGVVWFRLPTDADSRAWSLDTWRAVVTDRLPPMRVAAALVPAESAGLWTVALANEGTIDGRVPREVQLDASCVLADGANGFHLRTAGGGPAPVLESNGTGRLRAHTTRVIGWARCTQPQRQLHVVQ